MGRALLIAALIVMGRSPVATADEIPLKEIWAFDMPGTSDVASIEIGPGEDYQELNRMRETAIDKIQLALRSKLPAEPAMQGFVIPLRPNIVALRHIGAALRGKLIGLQPPNDEADTTLFFFTHPTSYIVQLTEVKRDDNVVTVRYQFVPNKTLDESVHFALIPLGKLPAGEYRVRFEEAPIDRKLHDDGFVRLSAEQVRQVICQSFTFTVEPSVPADVRNNAVEIPISAIFGQHIDGAQPISFLAPGKLGKDGKYEMTEPSPVTAISRHLGKRWAEKPEGFVVKGSAEHALLTAKQQLVDGAEPQQLDDTDRLWLFFFTRNGPLKMSIASVTIDDHRIDVRYKFPKDTFGHMASLAHYALIPLGQLKAGEYDVMIPKETFVCDSFKFYVENSR